MDSKYFPVSYISSFARELLFDEFSNQIHHVVNQWSWDYCNAILFNLDMFLFAESGWE